MTLFLDTSDLKKVRFSLLTDRSVKSKTLQIPYEENHRTLEHLDIFLRANKTKPSVLKQIVISSGPGSFTGLRVAASIAQGFKLAFGIPVFVVKKNKLPKDIKKLASMKFSPGLELDYGKPAVY